MASIGHYKLTHWGRVTHICVGKTAIIGSDNGLLPGRHQAIIWTNAGILLIGTLGTNLSEILIKCHSFSFRKMHMEMSSGKWRPSCLRLNVLTCSLGYLGWKKFLLVRFNFITMVQNKIFMQHSNNKDRRDLAIIDRVCSSFEITRMLDQSPPWGNYGFSVVGIWGKIMSIV